MIVLDDGRARAEVHPELGGAMGRYDVIDGTGQPVPIFQTAPSVGRIGPYAMGLNLLVPFSNRISGGGFRYDGVFHALDRNTPDPYPIHGNAFALPWSVRNQTGSSVVLTLASEGPGPFRYNAELEYRLSGGALDILLRVVNRAALCLPYGVGLHPWFVRTPNTRLTTHAAGYWTETPDHLPDSYVPCAGDPRFDLARGRALPEDFFNNALTGWDGSATLEWPDRSLAVAVTASPPLTTLILYSPSAAADYVCIEPVSHSVDAHNRTGFGVAPPQVLAPGEASVVDVSIRPYAL